MRKKDYWWKKIESAFVGNTSMPHKGRKHKPKLNKMNPVTSTVVVTAVTEPDYHFVVTNSDGTSYQDSQVAPDGPTARAQALAKLDAMKAAISADTTA
jgi:hypothetical protein